MARPKKEKLVTLIEELYTSGDYSDLTLTCGAHKFHVHKNIVCPQVPFFAGAVRFAAATNNTNNSIDLSKDDPSAVKALVEYLYKADYQPYKESVLDTCPGGSSVHEICVHQACDGWYCACTTVDYKCLRCTPIVPADLELHIKVYQLADMCQVSGLMSLASEKFAIACHHSWETTEFINAAQSAAKVGKDLDDAIISTVGYHLKLRHHPKIECLFSEYAHLAVGVLRLRSVRLGQKKDVCTEREG